MHFLLSHGRALNTLRNDSPALITSYVSAVTCWPMILQPGRRLLSLGGGNVRFAARSVWRGVGHLDHASAILVASIVELADAVVGH